MVRGGEAKEDSQLKVNKVYNVILFAVFKLEKDGFTPRLFLCLK